MLPSRDADTVNYRKLYW